MKPRMITVEPVKLKQDEGLGFRGWRVSVAILARLQRGGAVNSLCTDADRQVGTQH